MKTDILPKLICTICWDKVAAFHEFYCDVHVGQENFVQNWVTNKNCPVDGDGGDCSSAPNMTTEFDVNPGVSHVIIKPDPDIECLSFADESIYEENDENAEDATMDDEMMDDEMDHEPEVSGKAAVDVGLVDQNVNTSRMCEFLEQQMNKMKQEIMTDVEKQMKGMMDKYVAGMDKYVAGMDKISVDINKSLTNQASTSVAADDDDGFNQFPIASFEQLQEFDRLMLDKFNSKKLVRYWVRKLKKAVNSREFKKSTPAGHILFTKWFATRKLFTEVVYQSNNRAGKPKLVDMKGFLKVLHAILSAVDNGTYGEMTGVKSFLMDFIKYASRSLKA